MKTITILPVFICILWSICCARTVQLTDGAGRQVSICPESNLIVLITTQELLRILGVEDRVVGVHRWVKGLHSDENPVMVKQPIVGGFGKGDVNYEKIIEIADRTQGEDIVITYASLWAEDVEIRLDKIEGIKVLKLTFHKTETFEPQSALLAKAVGREEEWRNFLDWRESVLQMVRNRLKQIKGMDKPLVYWDASAKGHYDTAGGQSAVAGIIRQAGGAFVGKDLTSGQIRVSPEWILNRNPEFLLSHDNNMYHLTGRRLGYAETTLPGKEALVKLAMVPGLSGSVAVKKQNIHFVQDDLMSGPKQVIGILRLAKWFYPELFADTDPKVPHREFYERFMRLPFKGIHVYPEN